MDAAASPKTDAEFDKVYDFFFKIGNSAFPASIKQRHSVIKYTKLPDVEYDSKVTWQEETYTVQPRLRRVAIINEPKLSTTRSLKSDIAIAPKTLIPSITKRKIVTIEEDDENDLHPKFSRDNRKYLTKTSSRAVGTEIKGDKNASQRTTSRLSTCSKYSKDTKLSTKTDVLYTKKDNDPVKLNYKSKHSAPENISAPFYGKNVKNKEREGITRSSKSVYSTSKISVSKNLMTPSENEKDVCLTKSKYSENWINNITSKKMIDKRINKTPPAQNKSKASYTKEIKEMNKPVTVIHVPLDDRFRKRENTAEISESIVNNTLNEVTKVNCGTEVDKNIYSKDMNVGTEPLPTSVDQMTEIDTEFETICRCLEAIKVETDLKKTFDSLKIPNVTLIKDKNNASKESVVNFCSKSLPNVKVSLFNTDDHDKVATHDSSYSKSTSYIIRRATVTYTTKQKINFHVVGKNDKIINDISASRISYPLNVVSLFKKEVNNKYLCGNNESKSGRNDDKLLSYSTNSYDSKPPNCPYDFDYSKLVKPSEIISTIGVHCGLLQRDYICEQFQRELNFIDSFFESLQYLEHCSLADKCLTENKVESWINKSGFDLKNLEYESILSKFDNEACVDDSETMASKSLCLLNLLIRDEQRRAKNLLFVLKMREDALKDFTKSQILWLENKKRHENTDVSTLKKKQRGALLKLQHECGEMQRMRKALLTLSEKRKVALIKTKKNIELKLKNNLDVDQIILRKKKIKRNIGTDRNLAPIKCFDLSSSGCDDSLTSRARSETHVITPDIPAITEKITSVEKSIQTGDSVLGAVTVDQATNTAEENFVVVDGGYLNILFHNLSLPRIFSSGKQYEVNEEALKNIVNTANTNRNSVIESGDIEKFMDQIKNYDVDKSTSPSTARSLVEEFDQYYKVMVEEDNISTQEIPAIASPGICEGRDTVIKMAEASVIKSDCDVEKIENINSKEDIQQGLNHSIPVMESECVCEPVAVEVLEAKSQKVASVAGPLPVPAGAPADADSSTSDVAVWPTREVLHSPETEDITSSSSDSLSPSTLSMSSIASPVHVEAEELRRQQLAIEREIKALEQQQCQLLVVREIPDKPPPPYTPPTETRIPKPPRMFLLDDATEHKIQQYITESNKNIFDSIEPFEVFVKDFCHQTLTQQTPEESDKPWDSINLLPKKPPDSEEKVLQSTNSHLAEVLKGATPTVVSGVGARRSDHIDDILFAEWCRCEPEWTALHTDEATVKNQLFESIFQRVLTETVDEYKRTVLNVSDASETDNDYQ